MCMIFAIASILLCFADCNVGSSERETYTLEPVDAPNRLANTRETFPDWRFPIRRPHAGPVLGNASTGLMLWGGGSRLVLSLGRPSFWSHRGGAEWIAAQNYRDISAALARQDEAALDRIFPKGGERPSVMAFGRVEIVLPDDATLANARLDMRAAKIVLTLDDGRRFTVLLDWPTGTVVAAFPENLAPVSVRAIPAWRAARCRAAFERLGAPSPTEAPDGFEQTLPDDAGAALALRAAGNAWFASSGVTLDEARATALRVSGEGVDAVAGRTAARWAEFWRDTPSVRVPNPVLQRAYDYGMFKFGASTSAEPSSVPCPLQGPWYEDYQPPPWGGDYHFNINVQECYLPAYCGNHLAHLRPLFARIETWMPRLRENARLFVGIDDGVVLPHAVTDRGMAVTTEWWSGMIDHGSTLWVADMMWRHYAYGGSRDFLERTAFPFMTGAFNVLWKMLERDASGAFALPVAPSPEYRGAAYDAWGRNPSFQLAVARRVAEDLIAAADALGREPDARWAELLAKLPEVTTVGEGFDREIAVWDGLALGESHRHHSHLAAVFPFDTIDCEAKEWRDLVARTFATWQGHGMGGWTGWCVPWASILQTRVGNAEAAEFLLETWDRVFCNEGHNTLHNPRFTGFSQFGCWRGIMTASGGEALVDDDLNDEIMQLDASGAATTAVVEMLIHDRRGVARLFRGAPRAWNDCSFDRVLMPGGVLVSAARRDGRVTEIRFQATVRDTVFRYESPWKPGEIVELPLKAGKVVCANRES